MKAKILFAFPICLSLLLSNPVYAQYPSENQQALQTDKTPAQLHLQNMQEKAAIDLAQITKVVHINKAQKTKLLEGFVDMEEEKYQNNLTTNPNKMDVMELRSKINRETTDLLQEVLTEKELSTYYDKHGN